jgi:uncharacterized repeat protein (TIGR01451 family)
MSGSQRRRGISALTGVAALGAMIAILAGPIGGATAAPGPTDLQLTKSDSPDPVVEKTDLVYTIQVRNLGAGGTADAENVVVTDTLPAGVTFVSATTASGTCDRANRTVTCQLGTLLAGSVATVTIAVKAGDDGTISNTASVATGPAVDTDLSNNQDTESTTVSKAPTTPKTPKSPKTKKPKKVKAQGCSSPTITGTAASDRLVGTAGVDVIRGLAGNDVILGGGGNDIICADFGSDIAAGGLGADTIIGGGGRDRLLGGGGGDILRGKSGPDKLRGQGGPDLLNGGSSTRDKCSGGGGRDIKRACP